MPARIIAILVGLSLLTSCAQEMSWEGYNDAAVEAYEQARYAEAEELLLGCPPEKFHPKKKGRVSTGAGYPRANTFQCSDPVSAIA